MAIFTDMDQTATVHGFTLTARIEPDHYHGTPWEECDGHGPVSEWTTRDKAPGELVLCEDRGSRRFYDYAEACRIARRDGWGFMPHKVEIAPDDPNRPPYTACGGRVTAGPFTAYDPENFNRAIADVYAQHRATMTARQYAAAAATADFERLRGWCNDEWSYVGVIVTASRNGIELGSASLWRIESDDGEYLLETANELADEAISDALTQAA
jgi:hypothetical protein